ncbi:NAD-binding protein [Haladaptatus sp. DYSN1]|uniref:NAD-binding protein n=1 Tax=unclassified Haladaptatus TaxID=2622732 RepID=UPI0024062026|nr:NAD-binding protein [Haladaptatus sp. DYSN1]
MHMTSNPPVKTDQPNYGAKNAYYILGDTHLSVAVAHRLSADGHSVCIVTEADTRSELPGVRGNPADLRTLEAAGVADASTVIVATGTDRQNLLIAQLVRARFGARRVIALVNEPDRIPLFVDAGHEPLCVTTALADAIGEVV